MRNNLRFIFILAALTMSQALWAQCPGCTVNTSCYIPGGGLCPDSLPAGTQGTPYDENVTAYLPPTIDAGPFSGGVLGIVPLQSVHINSIAGLPFGLNWTCDHPGNNFYPSSGDTLGCVKICGTPISAAGIYNVVVNVTAGVNAGALGIQYADVNFNFQMVLFANSSGNIAYNYSPSSSCDTGTFTFTPIITATLPQIVSYDWDYGDGNTATGASPAPHTYSAPGDYAVTCTTTINVLTLTALNVVAAGNWWCGDVEETNWPFVGCTAAPDLYFRFTHGSSTYTSSSGSDNATQSWTGLNVPLSSTTIAIQTWDEDAVSADDDGGTYTTNITAPGVYGFNATSPWGGTSSGSFTISLTVDTQIIVTDTMHVYPLPPVPSISASATDYCPGDSVMLTTVGGYSYEWWLNDTVLIGTGTDSTKWVSAPGSYSVRVYNQTTGCSNISSQVTITENPPIPWTFAITWSVANGWMQSNLGAGSYTYQWQTYSGSSWVDIPAPAGTVGNYTPTGNGQFRLIAVNAAGCTDTAVYNFNTFGLEDQQLVSQLSIYPNPTTGYFTLDMQDISSDIIQVSLINMVGQTVMSKEFEVSGNFNQSFDLSGYAAGIYTVDIRIGNNNIRKKLIKE